MKVGSSLLTWPLLGVLDFEEFVQTSGLTIKTGACQVYSQKILYETNHRFIELLSEPSLLTWTMRHLRTIPPHVSCLPSDTNECRPLIGCWDSALASDWSMGVTPSRHPLISSYCASRHCFRLITCDLYIHNGHHDKQISSGVFRVYVHRKSSSQSEVIVANEKQMISVSKMF